MKNMGAACVEAAPVAAGRDAIPYDVFPIVARIGLPTSRFSAPVGLGETREKH